MWYRVKLSYVNVSKFDKPKPFPKQQTLDSSKLKEFADDNSRFDGNGRKFS